MDIEVQIPPKALVYWGPPQRGSTEPYNGTGPMPKIILATNWGIKGMTLHTRRSQPTLRHRWSQRRARREVRQLLWHYLSRPLYHYVARNHPLAGTSTRYSVMPTLPAGLEIDSRTGGISGSPSEISGERLYTVTGCNTAGSVSTNLILEVLDAPSAPIYKGKQIEMPPMKTGSQNTPSEVTAITCTRIGYLRGEDIKIEAPEMYGTQPFLFNIMPSLPHGLNLNYDTGSIRGMIKTAVPIANQHFTVRCKNMAGTGFAVINLIPESLMAGRVIDVRPVSQVKGGWKPHGLSHQCVFLIKAPGSESSEEIWESNEPGKWQKAQAALQRSRGAGDITRPPSRHSNTAFSPPPPPTYPRPDSADYESNPSAAPSILGSRPTSSAGISPAGSRPASAASKRVQAASSPKGPLQPFPPPAAASSPSRPQSALTRRSRPQSAVSVKSVPEDQVAEEEGEEDMEEISCRRERLVTMAAGTDEHGFFSCRGLAGMYVLAGLTV